ncbi:hypothetical protein GGH99_007565 [Coemansia sp. RSA 1285]|nr:hypothetical protein GGH99_007565 [Coemansia sp. RSA 1285]
MLRLSRSIHKHQNLLASAHCFTTDAKQPGHGVFAAKRADDCMLGRTPAQLARTPPIGYVYLGAGIEYLKALELQQWLVRKRIDEIHGQHQQPGKQQNKEAWKDRKYPDVLLLLQHAPVYTNGRRNRGKLAAAEIKRLCKSGDYAEYVETSRGGEITFHGPGQLVVYPIMHLRDHSLGARCFVDGLENSVIETCARFAVDAHRMAGFPGVWASDTQKIAALGTRCQRYVTSHGVALNCTTDLRWFDRIVPCGLDGKVATSLEHILLHRCDDGSGDRTASKPDVSVNSVLPVMLDSFASAFGCDVVPLERLSPATFSEIQTKLASIDQQPSTHACHL